MPPESNADASRTILADALMRAGIGDRQAFGQVYVPTQAKLLGVCVRICGEPAAAEDVLAEVYLTIWRQSHAWTPGRSSPITWRAVIARNRAIDWRRAQTLRRTQPLEDAANIMDPALCPDAALQVAQTTRSLLRSLEALGSQQRTAIQSALFEGETYAQIAEFRGVPLATGKSRIRRGLRKMSQPPELADDLSPNVEDGQFTIERSADSQRQEAGLSSW